MPATEQTYRSQPTLHIVFAVSSIAMMLVIVWMILADHLRPWKQYQREFHGIDTAKLRANEEQVRQEELAKHQDELEAIEQQMAQARELARQNHREIATQQRAIRAIEGRFQNLDTLRKFKQAELDSQRTLYDGMIARGERVEARNYKNTTITQTERDLFTLTRQFQDIEQELNEARAELSNLRGNIDELERERGRLTREIDRVQRLLEQREKEYGEGTLRNRMLAWFRGLPLVDLAAPPTKIQQITLPELTINYNFKDVPRFDRCATCHLGIDRPGYDTDAEGNPMPTVFASHPHLTDGATMLDPAGREVEVGLYLDGNGPHPINSFGCTICHGGQGSGTDFTFASHEPNDLEQRHEWEKKYHWHEMHHWDFPMLPSRFLQSSCLKCHHQVTDIPYEQAPKLMAGYERIVKYGCTGCHTIGGPNVFGPDLSDERQVGPNLDHLASKVSKDWMLKWLKDPHAFLPDARMPKFFGVTNNDAPEDWPKNHAEIHAITHFLFARSTPPAGFRDPPQQSDPERGQELFLQKGCIACHSHSEYGPDRFPESVRAYAEADYGPDLSNIAAKFASHDEGYRWLANWIHEPEAYHPNSLMPNLQLSVQDAADLASWILSVPAEWPGGEVDVPSLDSAEVQEGLDELVSLFKRKDGVPLSRLDQTVEAMDADEKLMYLGEKTVSRLGCFGCHTISGFEDFKPIGTPLDDWGLKSPTKLEFGLIGEYLLDHRTRTDEGTYHYDGTDEYYKDKVLEHSRIGFLYQKLHRPRSFDYRKTDEGLMDWDERLRMPQFVWADDSEAIEEVMTFVLGLTGETIHSRYLPEMYYTPSQMARAEGTKLLNRYNCKACHVLSMPTYTIAAGTSIEEAMPGFESRVRIAYNNRSNDYPELTGLPYDPDQPPVLEPDNLQDGDVTIEGMPIFFDEFDNELTVQLWSPVTIRGFTFQAGDNLALDLSNVEETPADGGDFAWLYATDLSERTGDDFASIWNRLPPPLIRQGERVQTPWMTAFLRDPYPIRPAANLRMPQFHYERAHEETRDLANYFAARDGASFPYQEIPERDRQYLARREAEHPDYLAAGWDLMTKGACVQCHAIGPYAPTGGEDVVSGPDLWQVASRFRPDFLAEWLGRPSRILPYTAMPQNIPPHGPPGQFVPETFEDQPLAQVEAMRDTLLNYVMAVEQQLASQPAPSPPADLEDETAEEEAGAGGAE